MEVLIPWGPAVTLCRSPACSPCSHVWGAAQHFWKDRNSVSPCSRLTVVLAGSPSTYRLSMFSDAHTCCKRWESQWTLISPLHLSKNEKQDTEKRRRAQKRQRRNSTSLRIQEGAERRLSFFCFFLHLGGAPLSDSAWDTECWT